MCKDNSSYISSPSKIPDTPSKFQKYFDGKYRPASKGATIWPQIKLGIEIDQEVFLADAKSLLEDHDMSLFLKDLQSEQTETLGYFLFSHGQQCRLRLKNTISTHLKKQRGVDELLSIRWQKIMNSSKDSSSKDQPTKAFHVEVIKGHGARVTTGISFLYSSTRKKFPHNEKMRFIPYNRDVQHSSEATKNSDIINKQKWFIKLTSYASSFEVALLDFSHDDIGFSLRDLIMKMQHSSGSQLYISVDWNWNKSAVVFIFPTMYEQEARDRIADLASYLNYHHGDNLLRKYFTPDAAERAKRAPWDPDLGRAVSDHHKEMDKILEDCTQIDWLQHDKTEKVKVTFQTPPTETTHFHFSPTDDSSIPTLGVHSAVSTPTDNSENKDVDAASPDSSIASTSDQNTPDKDSITDEGDDTSVGTLASRFQTFKEGIEGQLKTITSILKTAQGNQIGNADSSDKRHHTPDSGQDEGEGPQ